MLKRFITIVLLIVSTAVSAKITLNDLENAEANAWDSVGNLQACESQFPGGGYDLVGLKVEEGIHRLLRASTFASSNFGEVFAGKVWLSKRVALAGLAGTITASGKASAQNQCTEKALEGRRLIKWLDAKAQAG